MAYRILAHEPVSESIERIAEELVVDLSTQLDDDGLNPDVRVHEVRKSCKRVRALLRLVRPALKTSVYRAENARYRDLARMAGATRDAKVALDSFDLLVGDEPHALARAAGLRAQLAEALRGRGEPVNPLQALEAIRPGLAEAWEALSDWRLHGRGFDVVGAGYRETYQRARAGLASVIERPSAEGFHEWRKHCKYSLFQTDLLLGAWKRPMRARRRALDALAGELGLEHDLHVLRGELLELSGAEVLDELLAALERESARLRDRCQRRGERLFAESPRAHQQRIRRYWKAWRRPSPADRS